MIRLNNEVTLFKGKLLGGETLEKDFSPYKRLLITYQCYYYTDKNTAGSSNVITLDLDTNKSSSNATSEEESGYIATVMHPYNMWSSSGTVGSVMAFAGKVDTKKTSFTPYFMFNQSPTDANENYYVSKIIGVKF